MRRELQVRTCNVKGIRGRVDALIAPPCFVCAYGRAASKDDCCRFQGFRTIETDDDGSVRAIFAADSHHAHASPTYAAVFDVPPDRVLADVARFLRPTLVRMLEHERAPDLIHRDSDFVRRVTCDLCDSALLFDSFLCVECGFNICPWCRDETRVSDVPSCVNRANTEDHMFRPLSTANRAEVESILAEVDTVISELPARALLPHTTESQSLYLLATHMRKIPTISKGQDLVFQILWSHQLPLVVKDVHLQGDWSPQAFISQCGEEDVWIIDSQCKKPRKAKAADFFTEFLRKDDERGSIIKLKDWPPSALFADKLRPRFNAFMDAVPMPSYTRHDGIRNFPSHYPEPPWLNESHKPDVGPKLYSGTKDTAQVGSTQLHLDVTSAVNILVYNSHSEETGALWHIFLADDLDKLRDYLRGLREVPTTEDPVHAQNVYLTPPMLAELRLLGVSPFVVKQKLGDAVFIPAGCAHQVSNTAACIKIACDFLCSEGVPRSAQVSAELRKEQRDDVLGLETMLWHAWISLRIIGDRLSLPTAVDGATRTQRKRARQRKIMRAKDDRARRKGKLETSVDEPVWPSSVLRCPHPDCEGSKRSFQHVHGVFNHLKMAHRTAVPPLPWVQYEGLSETEFKQRYREFVLYGSRNPDLQ